MPDPKKAPKPPTSLQETSVPWTVKRLLEWTTDYFTRAGLETARLDAEVLLAHALGEDRLSLYLNYAEKVPDDTRETYRDLVRRRRNFEPVAYLTGTREFYSLPFAVSPSVLIPRPETEHLVENALRFFQRHPSLPPHIPHQILDIGTGCGNITLALAIHLPRARIVSVDICREALMVAKKNLGDRPELRDRVFLVCGDLMEWLHPMEAGFHLIVSNPPYVTSGDWTRLAPEVRSYEPRRALDAGPQGTEIHERILSHAASFLLPGGLLLMEIGSGQERPLREAAEKLEGYDCINIFPDYSGRPRIMEARKTGGSPCADVPQCADR